MSGRKARSEWVGSLMEGKGNISVASGSLDGPFSFSSRVEDGKGTNPEELLAASLAGCYAMALNAALEKNETPAEKVEVEANAHLGKDDNGFAITRIDLEVKAEVPGMSDDAFQAIAEDTKKTCPISKALAATNITMKAELKG